MRASGNEEHKENDKEYSLYTEQIAPNPRKKIKKTMMKALKIVASAALFGTVAAIFFVFFSSVAGKLKNSDEEPESPTITFTLDEDTTEDEETQTQTQPIEDIVQNAIEKRELTKDDYKSMYAALMDVADSGMNSLVTVVSVVNEVDWFDNSYEKNGNTSGVIIASDDTRILVLTNYDAISGADNIRVLLASGNTVDATLLKGDTATNLAVVAVDRSVLNVADLDKIEVANLGNSYMVELGEPLIAIGNIFGYNNTMNYGIATGVKKVVQETDGSYTIINTNITCSNGGTGILLNMDGQVVGIATSKYDGEVSDGVRLITAYSISDLKILMQQLSNNRDVPCLGIYGQSVTQSMKTSYGFPAGVYVTSSKQDSPAFVSGIQSGDIITGINGQSIETMEEYQQLLYSYSSGDVIMVNAMRQGRDGYIEIEFQCTVGVE